jgi:ATP-dependent metalloprotease FtsH
MTDTDPTRAQPPKRPAAPRRRRRRWRRSLPLGGWVLVALLVLLAAFFAVLELSRPHPEGDRLSISAMERYIDDARIRSGRILDADGFLVGKYRRADGTIATYNAPYFRNDPGARQALARQLLDANIPSTIVQQVAKALIFPALLLLLPALMFVIVIIYMRVSSARGTGLFGIRSGARRIRGQESDSSFAEVAGQDEAVAALREISEFLARPERYAAVGVTIPKGVLLYGPPGCGKTLLARALAGESGAAFFSISGSDFVELYVGVGASRVRELFREAREQAPAIVFIDELDSLAQHRAAGGDPSSGSGAEQEQALNQLLAEMDGFSTTAGVMVVGATNRPDTLDPALLRPGRFDRSIGLELPDLHGREAILGVHVRGKPVAAGTDLAAIAARAVGMTGADLASLVNEAGLLAARDGRAEIGQADFDVAVEKILEAPERQRRLSLRARSVGRRTLAEDRVTFADVAGLDRAIEELREIREYLGAPDRYVEMGARVPRGYLLSGPPGCGKTQLARAVAGESKAAFVSVAATEFIQRYAGEGAARVRDLFADARSMAPAIVFIDEIDAVGTARGGLDDSGERHQTLNQILVELDGFSQRAGIVVIAATNRLDVLDPALVRPGRFDRHVLIDPPDLQARREILALHAIGKPLAGDADLETIARLTQGMGGADLANVMNEAALLTARRRDHAISMAVLDEAIERASFGIGSARTMTAADRRMVAYHEAGHGLVAMALPGGRILHRITIIPRGRALGAAWVLDAGEGITHTHTALMERMAMMLGGRAAEEVVLGELSDAAGSDLASVTDLAHRMVSELGMSDAVGPLSYGGAFRGSREPSPDTARLIDAEVRRLVEEAGAMAIGVLTRSRAGLDRVAEALLERETLTLEEVAELAGPIATAAPRRPR